MVVGDEDFGNTLRVQIEGFYILEQDRASTPGVKEQLLAVGFHQARKAPGGFKVGLPGLLS